MRNRLPTFPTNIQTPFAVKKLFFLFLLLPTLSHAQDSTGNFTRRSVWRVLFPVGISNERRLGPRTTLVTDLQLGGYWTASGSSSTGARSGFYQSYYVNAIVVAGVRQFYNFQRRLERNKSIRYNSGNYVMARVGYSSLPFVQRNDAVVQFRSPELVFGQLLWGFQRTYRRNFYLNLNLGVGASTRRVAPVIDFTLGYTFPSRH